MLGILAMAATVSTSASEVREVKGSAPEPPPSPALTRWIGTMSLLGSRHVPLLGQVDFRTDTYVISEVRRVGDAWELVQTTCRVGFSKTAGAELALAPNATSSIPISELAFVAGPDGSYKAGPWPSGWGQTDHDRDGEPGITVFVKAPLCGGELAMESRATNNAVGRRTEDAVLAGEIRVYVDQKILGAKGPCLRLMARDRAEWMEGRFAYVEVPQSATCVNLPASTWPDPFLDEPG